MRDPADLALVSGASVPPLRLREIAIGSFSEAAKAAGGTVVIIDVFRAFTTAAVALSNGAREIIMADSLDAAIELRRQGAGRYCIGERRGARPEGFDFGNSPAEIADHRFDGETLIQTTTNGTRGILAAAAAERIYAASFITARATAAAIRRDAPRPVTLVAMGDGDRQRTDEDEITALYIRSLLLGLEPDAAPVAAAIRSMCLRIDGEKLSAADVDACLSATPTPFALRIGARDGLTVLTAEKVSV